ncbi:MAG: 2-oxoacid:ferredoxin oxidoreductase subunit beta [Phycisphaerae bacterium]|nr:2-oxoacid:ferredoxin oxidoreductase subunit beta [Phycisphaerae bacterium]
MAATTSAPTVSLQPKDYGSSQEIRWCPGCGNYSILTQLKKVCSNLGKDPDKLVFVSGIGCSSRLPYYMGTYGVHSIHGRAPALATGLRLARPDLEIWVITGDGDGLSIGGNHLLHAFRRNLNIKIIMFNNRIYGLTKGQVSPTSEMNKKTISTPYGSIGAMINPCSVAIGCEATFVARTVDMIPAHLQKTLERAAAHRGVAFVEVYQNCNIFNDGAFKYSTDREIREDHVVELEHGKALIFGKDQTKGLRIGRNYCPEVVTLGENGMSIYDLLIHDERASSPALAFLLSRLRHPDYPEPIGVFRAVKSPIYNDLIEEQIRRLTQERGAPDMQKLMYGPETWEVN